MGVKRLKVSIGVDLGGTNIKFGLVTSEGKILKRLNIPTQANQGPKSVVARIINCLNCLKQSRVQLQAVGIGSAGVIDHYRGIIHYSPNLYGWNEIPLKKWIEKEIRIPVLVGNDVNAFVLGEYCFGAAKCSNSVFGLTLGTGVGGGIINNGKLLLGINHAAGEIGHTSINAFGMKCRCGNLGCLERYVGAEYIVQRYLKYIPALPPDSGLTRWSIRQADKKITPEIIARAAKRGDKLAKAIIKETGIYVGVGLANVVSLIDPAVIVIGGGVSGFGKPLLDSIKKTVAERIMNFACRKLRIVLSKLKDDAAILGASQFKKFL